MKEMYLYNNLTIPDIKNLIPAKAVLFFDTESSFINKNTNIPQRDEEGKLNKDFNFSVHVYAWAIANNCNDNVIYGHNLNDFLKFLYDFKTTIFENKTYTEKQLEKTSKNIEIWVHNLQWDLEFLKYELEKQNYKYENSKISVTKEKIHKNLSRGHYFIVESGGIVYASQLTLKKGITVEVSKNKKVSKEIRPVTISFHDSMKVTNTSLDNIARDLLTLNHDRLKIEGYDYDKHRPIGHILTEEEQEYLYNDVYILKEWYNQYYYNLETKHKTASSIAFERICKLTYGENFKYKQHFLTHFPPVEAYTAKELIDDSYQGGITQVNRHYQGKVQLFNDLKASIDIVSSYPSILVNKPLPIGNPIRSYDFENNKTITNNPTKYFKELEEYKAQGKLILYKIGFDAFKNKHKNNLIGEIQIGSINREEFQEHFKNVNSGNEYIHTNIINKNKIIGGNGKHQRYRYIKTYWNFELDSILKNTIFLQGEQKYCPDREFYFFPKTLQLEKGYTILAATVFEEYTGFFSDGILDGYNKKNEGKKEGNKIKEQTNKTYINSFYGKLAANPERLERYSFLNEETELMEYKPTNIKYYDTKKYYKAMASCVTAWGRCNLRETLYKICSYDPEAKKITKNKFFNNVMYMDTDSLYTTLTAEEIINIIPDKISNKLGSWSLESEYNKFKAIGQKKYIFNGRKINKEAELKTICKCAGLPEAARKEQTFGSFKIGAVIEGKKVKKKVTGGYALIYDTYTICNNIL